MKESVPLYQQLKSRLLDNILGGTWKPGELLPSEAALAEAFQVSRTTVRQAIGDLVSSGYIIRQQGKGSYVARRSTSQAASRLYGFAEELRQRNLDVHIVIDEISTVPCSQQLAEKLGWVPNTPMLRIVRRALVDGTCWFVETSHLFVPFGASPSQWVDDPDAFNNVYGFFERHGIRIASGSQSIGADLADERDQRLFGVAVGAPILTIERLSHTETGAAVEHSIVRYPANLYKYEVQLERSSER